MKTINPETAVIVFDLDDTLYSEYEYKLSGIRVVVDTVVALYPDWNSDDLWRSIDPDGKDWLDKLCRHCGFNESEKQVLLWQYRLHRPTLTPYASPDFLSELTAPFVASALITDGRSLTQRLKLEALGLSSLFDDILVSQPPPPKLDRRFVLEAELQGLCLLKGYKTVGGMRASIYNAMPLEGVNALADFMKDFQRRYG